MPINKLSPSENRNSSGLELSSGMAEVRIVQAKGKISSGDSPGGVVLKPCTQQMESATVMTSSMQSTKADGVQMAIKEPN